MLSMKLPIIGQVTRIESDKIIVVRGEVTDSYNPNYYRILTEVEDGQVQRAAVLEREAGSR